ncbi:dual adapter for phosphotyrosine and 3-phosphotyrosine and 3-phosphoinositide-like isoform X1 [Gigantopelta aegis]|uniref:dual adapter for phosphotyrosine and 3-phosphotyrosine and 3-phosphoinositide-like isoform X1 n=1 Tax=Gigantopelta aegis TaxID=1735272 RepID=UPI001B88C8D9|nr:dual adapter for phosphotyrosine and 3-phosphotyrosine and 3-phosphoinositide-like isoform X1 [Gigantopelta aegis]XP_041363516.1 dual adapter for phosphotyrosine and 3-phosphotyrosine and 3-phosphoinositide-like isoform X1 [Gigantopelta aegis]XP_041363517.1 dual adapter for phosphotyrosine and 3-phosphotyrosine and 3-phosphoinositide-like isoform X1 [Gigantopelta aegis]
MEQDSMSCYEDIENLEFFHPNLTRHTAESMLLQNGTDGTYLLRPSSKTGKHWEYALSVKCDKSVKHFNVSWTGTEFQFGHGTFKSLQDLLTHFSNQPLIGGESGQLVLLCRPYPRDIAEPDLYEEVTVHAELSTADANNTTSGFSINSKEGFLTKEGRYFKTWRTRWFLLQKNELKYYKEKTDKSPIRVLDLNTCRECSQDNSKKPKPFVFRLVFDWRTFYMSASSEQDMKEWINVITWRLNR